MKPNYDVCLVTDYGIAGERHAGEVVLEALEGGVRMIQYREKKLSARFQVALASRLCKLAHRFGAHFLVNDRVDIALSVGADGVHLGQDDLPLPMARKILGPRSLIGVSVQNVEEALQAAEEGADYLGVSAIFPTPTKEEGPVLGISGLLAIRRAVKLPLMALGGINMDNAAEVIKAGADGVAVVSAIVCAPDVREAASRLVATVQQTRGQD